MSDITFIHFYYFPKGEHYSYCAFVFDSESATLKFSDFNVLNEEFHEKCSTLFEQLKQELAPKIMKAKMENAPCNISLQDESYRFLDGDLDKPFPDVEDLYMEF